MKKRGKNTIKGASKVEFALLIMCIALVGGVPLKFMGEATGEAYSKAQYEMSGGGSTTDQYIETITMPPPPPPPAPNTGVGTAGVSGINTESTEGNVEAGEP